MQASSKAIDLIKEFESFSAKVYICPAGKLTIGYGHVITTADQELKNKILTQKDAEELLKEDLKYFVDYINKVCNRYQVNLNQNQFDALCSFCFNLGNFTNAMLERFKAKDIKAIGDSLTLYNKVNSKELKGLTKRRKAEQELFFS